MIELKNKKTGKIDILQNEEYAKIKDHPKMSKFQVTQLTTRPLIPSLKVEPKHKK
jgi:hypothetical protein